MTVLELSELIKAMEEKFGVSAAAAVAVPPRRAARRRGAAAEEQTEFTVVLTAIGENKVNVIKAVREITGPGPEGSQGPGRRRAEARQGRHQQGRRRSRQEEAGRRRREGGNQVTQPAPKVRVQRRRVGGRRRFDAGLKRPRRRKHEADSHIEVCFSSSSEATAEDRFGRARAMQRAVVRQRLVAANHQARGRNAPGQSMNDGATAGASSGSGARPRRSYRRSHGDQ